MPIGKAQPLANAGIERLPVIMGVVFTPVSAAFEIVVKYFIFLPNFSFLEILSKNRPEPHLFFSAYNFVNLPLVVLSLYILIVFI